MERELTSRDTSGPMEIELADIAAILQMNAILAAVPAAKAPRQNHGARGKSRRCSCGKCRCCADNARWEAVFQQKFADPYYYSLREPRQGSSLNGF
jgi:hypothetical protein